MLRALAAVEDTGPGIPAEQLPNVFGQFWQGARTDKRGIGVGLAIAKRIIEAPRGRLWVESTVGSGSSVSFTLPMHTDAHHGLAPRSRCMLTCRQRSSGLSPASGSHLPRE